MASKREMEERLGFTDMTVKLEKNIFRLCNETYKATKKPLSESRLRDLIQEAEAQIAEYETLLGKYTGGKRESIVNAGSQITALKEFTKKLQSIIKER